MNNYKSNTMPDVSSAPPAQSKRDLRRIGNGIGIGFVVMVVVNYMLSFLIEPLAILSPTLESFIFDIHQEGGQSVRYMSMEFYTIFTFVSYVAGFVAAILVSKAIVKIPAKVAFPLKRVNASTLIAGVFICLASIQTGAYLTTLLSSVLDDLSGYSPQMPFFGDPQGPLYKFIHFLDIAVGAAILEEFLCRGVVLQSLRRYGDNFALIVSAFIFGIMHGNLAQAPYAIVVGLALGYLVLYTGSLWPSIIAHFINNGMNEIISTVLVPYTTAQQQYTLSSILRLVFVAGGLISIIYLRRRDGSLFYVKRQHEGMPERTKYVTFFTSIGMLIFMAWEIYNIIMNLMSYAG